MLRRNLCSASPVHPPVRKLPAHIGSSSMSTEDVSDKRLGHVFIVLHGPPDTSCFCRNSFGECPVYRLL